MQVNDAHVQLAAQVEQAVCGSAEQGRPIGEDVQSIVELLRAQIGSNEVTLEELQLISEAIDGLVGDGKISAEHGQACRSEIWAAIDTAVDTMQLRVESQGQAWAAFANGGDSAPDPRAERHLQQAVEAAVNQAVQSEGMNGQIMEPVMALLERDTQGNAVTPQELRVIQQTIHGMVQSGRLHPKQGEDLQLAFKNAIERAISHGRLRALGADAYAPRELSNAVAHNVCEAARQGQIGPEHLRPVLDLLAANIGGNRMTPAEYRIIQQTIREQVRSGALTPEQGEHANHALQQAIQQAIQSGQLEAMPSSAYADQGLSDAVRAVVDEAMRGGGTPGPEQLERVLSLLEENIGGNLVTPRETMIIQSTIETMVQEGVLPPETADSMQRAFKDALAGAVQDGRLVAMPSSAYAPMQLAATVREAVLESARSGQIGPAQLEPILDRLQAEMGGNLVTPAEFQIVQDTIKGLARSGAVPPQHAEAWQRTLQNAIENAVAHGDLRAMPPSAYATLRLHNTVQQAAHEAAKAGRVERCHLEPVLDLVRGFNGVGIITPEEHQVIGRTIDQMVHDGELAPAQAAAYQRALQAAIRDAIDGGQLQPLEPPADPQLAALGNVIEATAEQCSAGAIDAAAVGPVVGQLTSKIGIAVTPREHRMVFETLHRMAMQERIGWETASDFVVAFKEAVFEALVAEEARGQELEADIGQRFRHLQMNSRV